MTEAEWLQSSQPSEMLSFLGKRATVRKLRLFARSCFDQSSENWTDPRLCQVVRVAEQLTECGADKKDVQEALDALDDFMDEFCEHDVTPTIPPCIFADPFLGIDAGAVAWCIAEKAKYQDEGFAGIEEELQHDQACFLRDIFGNPFRPIAFDRRWRTPDAVGLARGINEDRAFDRLPLLADALMDAGCDDEQVLGHCRGPGPHVRGCWVVDLVLGKE